MYVETKNHSPNSCSGKVNLSGSSRNSLYLYGYAPFYRIGNIINCQLIGEKTVLCLQLLQSRCYLESSDICLLRIFLDIHAVIIIALINNCPIRYTTVYFDCFYWRCFHQDIDTINQQNQFFSVSKNQEWKSHRFMPCTFVGNVSTDLFLPLIPFRIMAFFIKLDLFNNILCLFPTVSCLNSDYVQSLWQANSFKIDKNTFQKYAHQDCFLYDETQWME